MTSVRRIAPARTFVEERELALMLASGQSATADPESVVVLGAETVHAAGRPFSADEPARHKLLDLIGDLALHGGPPRGEIVARRPGHAATHVAVARALADGILARDA
ncbi:MAG: UDP-3-O-acyl-N-acetylglucosamine deacetylase [Polyangiaceae bacterium]